MSLADYGHVPYGKIIANKISIVTPLNGCSPGSSTMKNNTIYLVERGKRFALVLFFFFFIQVFALFLKKHETLNKMAL